MIFNVPPLPEFINRMSKARLKKEHARIICGLYTQARVINALEENNPYKDRKQTNETERIF